MCCFTLQLPPPQLENALNRTAALKAPLIAHASQPNIRSSLPRFNQKLLKYLRKTHLFLPFSDLVNSIGCNVFRSVLVVLGIALDSQNSNQTQTTQPQSADTCNSDKAAETEKSKESSAAS